MYLIFLESSQDAAQNTHIVLSKRLSASSEIAAQSSLVKTLRQIIVLIITCWIFWNLTTGVDHWKRNKKKLKMNYSLATIDWHLTNKLSIEAFWFKKDSITFFIIIFYCKIALRRTLHRWICHEKALTFNYSNTPIDTKFNPESSFKYCYPNDLHHEFFYS